MPSATGVPFVYTRATARTVLLCFRRIMPPPTPHMQNFIFLFLSFCRFLCRLPSSNPHGNYMEGLAGSPLKILWRDWRLTLKSSDRSSYEPKTVEPNILKLSFSSSRRRKLFCRFTSFMNAHSEQCCMISGKRGLINTNSSVNRIQSIWVLRGS